MVNQKHHFYMGTALVPYARKQEIPLEDGSVETVSQLQQRHVNFITQTLEKKITANTIDVTRELLIQRICKESQIKPEDIYDIIFLNWAHLGFMTEKEFQDVPEEKTFKKSKKPRVS